MERISEVKIPPAMSPFGEYESLWWVIIEKKKKK